MVHEFGEAGATRDMCNLLDLPPASDRMTRFYQYELFSNDHFNDTVHTFDSALIAWVRDTGPDGQPLPKDANGHYPTIAMKPAATPTRLGSPRKLRPAPA